MKTFQEFFKNYSTKQLLKIALTMVQGNHSNDEDIESINQELDSRINGK